MLFIDLLTLKSPFEYFNTLLQFVTCARNSEIVNTHRVLSFSHKEYIALSNVIICAVSHSYKNVNSK